MRLQLESRKFNFYGLCFNLYIFNHPLDKKLKIVDSALRARCTRGRGDHIFFGNSASTDLDKAIKVSCFEIIERMLATRIFHSEDSLKEGFEGEDFISGDLLKSIDAYEVLIREPSFNNKVLLSASGLGLHSDPCKAKSHAIREIVERHLLCKIWYQNKEIYKLDELTEFIDGYEICTYTVSDEVPFALTVITSKKVNVFFSGASVSNNLSNACRKARLEALSLISNYLCKPFPPKIGNVKNTLDRLATLVGNKAIKYNHHFSKLISSNKIKMNSKTVNDLELLNLVYFQSDVQVYEVNEWNRLHLFRAIIPNALVKNEARRIYSGKVLSDPYC